MKLVYSSGKLGKLEQIREMIIWQFTVIGGLPYFCGKMGVYVVIPEFATWRDRNGVLMDSISHVNKRSFQYLSDLQNFEKIYLHLCPT